MCFPPKGPDWRYTFICSPAVTLTVEWNVILLCASKRRHVISPHNLFVRVRELWLLSDPSEGKLWSRVPWESVQGSLLARASNSLASNQLVELVLSYVVNTRYLATTRNTEAALYAAVVVTDCKRTVNASWVVRDGGTSLAPGMHYMPLGVIAALRLLRVVNRRLRLMGLRLWPQ
jgi:hypothetical protein